MSGIHTGVSAAGAVLLMACGPVEKQEPSASSEDSGVLLAPPGASPLDQAGWSVCINELMASNSLSLVLEDGSSPDWIELHNPSNIDIPLAGWTMANASTDAEAALDALEIIEAGGFVLLYADGATTGAPHLPFTLSKEGATVSLRRRDGGGDQIRYGETYEDQAIYRSTDCCASDEPDCFVSGYGGTPGASNRD